MNDFHYYTFPSFQNIVSSKKKKLVSACKMKFLFQIIWICTRILEPTYNRIKLQSAFILMEIMEASVWGGD
jgi:hypothetical protein